MVPIVYPIGYRVIYSIIKTIFVKKYKIKRLEMQAYLRNYLYKIKVILAVRVQGNKAAYYFCI